MRQELTKKASVADDWGLPVSVSPVGKITSMRHCTWLFNVDFRDRIQVPGLARHTLPRQSHLPSLETAFLRELTELDKYAINFS